MIRLLKPRQLLNSSRCYGERAIGARVGITLHFDDSGSDDAAVAWFRDPRCSVSYNRLYLDDGSVVQITPTMEHAAWHNGACREPNANRRYYGLAAATNWRTPVTAAQLASITHDCAALFIVNGWAAAEAERFIVGHEDICAPPGRKMDPTSLTNDRRGPRVPPILSTRDVRAGVMELLARVAA